MPTVKVLADAVGHWNAGDIVKDAPPGLIEIAKLGTRSAATGQLLAEILDETEVGLNSNWLAREKELLDKLQAAQSREVELLAKLADKGETDEDPDEELKALKATAKALKILGYTKMSADELREAIVTAGGVTNAE